jgi:organic hydroperoxide reductase OsmC/OhrA
MADYSAEVVWTLAEGEDFLAGRYSRGHTISFDGGARIAASASPHVVGKWAVAAAIDPEEMLVAALSNCHMLSFLHVARLAGFVARSYRGRDGTHSAREAGDHEGGPASADRVDGQGTGSSEAGPHAP